MGEYIDSRGIRNFQPDNDTSTLYIPCYGNVGIHELNEKIEEHFGISLMDGNFEICAEHIHTSCLGYNRYDPGDYTDYIVVRKCDDHDDYLKV